VGQKGSATWDGGGSFRAQVVAGKGGFFSDWEDREIEAADDPANLGHAGVMRDFADAVRTGRPPMTVCTDNIKSLAMVFGAIEASAQRKWYRIA